MLGTPTPCLIENNSWGISTGFEQEMADPFECSFQMRSPMMMREPIWSSSTLSPPTPPMSFSPSPRSSQTTTPESLQSTSPHNSIPDLVVNPTKTHRKKKEETDDDYLDYSPKSTGGRKRKIVFEGGDAEERRKKFLERNRVAAYKCRQKKKTWMQDLEQRADMSTLRNDELRSYVAQLKEESMYLRNLLLSHGNCDCESVQAYLRKTSAQITFSACVKRESSFMLPSYYESTGLTPFMDTVMSKDDEQTDRHDLSAFDYFSRTHTIA
ncbi:hypothetical protein BY458DRAFT_512384 [Sporodiniella umbellata]|nr:hypothetical protein BY458DRAFT_512384 [Sporodiniella umbellata]